MQKKNLWMLISGIVIVVAIALGGYALFRQPSKASSPTTKSAPSTSVSSPSTQAKSTSVNNALLMTKTNSSVGSYLADPSGNTLYTDGNGSAGVTSCAGSCLTAWPIYQDKGLTTGLPANISTIKRSDNSEIQYTYKDMPLYYFSSDSQGQVTGNGASGFYVAKP